MKIIIAFAALVVVAIAGPADDRDVVVVNESPLDNDGLGDYKYAYALSNGATKEEIAHYVDGPDGPSAVVEGSYAYTAPDGQPIFVKYVADKDGYRAIGDHITA